MVVCGHVEDRVRLDGPVSNYAANVCEFATVRNLLFTPRQDPSKLSRKHGKDNDAEIIASCDIQGGLGASSTENVWPVSLGCSGGAQRSCGDHIHLIQLCFYKKTLILKNWPIFPICM